MSGLRFFRRLDVLGKEKKNDCALLVNSII